MWTRTQAGLQPRTSSRGKSPHPSPVCPSCCPLYVCSPCVDYARQTTVPARRLDRAKHLYHVPDCVATLYTHNASTSSSKLLSRLGRHYRQEHMTQRQRGSLDPTAVEYERSATGVLRTVNRTLAPLKEPHQLGLTLTNQDLGYIFNNKCVL